MQKRHFLWKEYVTSLHLVISELLQAASLVCCSVEFLFPRIRRVSALMLATLISAVAAAATLVPITTSARNESWMELELLWLPLLPLGFCALMWVPVRMFKSSRLEVRKNTNELDAVLSSMNCGWYFH